MTDILEPMVKPIPLTEEHTRKKKEKYLRVEGEEGVRIRSDPMDSSLLTGLLTKATVIKVIRQKGAWMLHRSELSSGQVRCGWSKWRRGVFSRHNPEYIPELHKKIQQQEKIFSEKQVLLQQQKIEEEKQYQRKVIPSSCTRFQTLAPRKREKRKKETRSHTLPWKENDRIKCNRDVIYRGMDIMKDQEFVVQSISLGKRKKYKFMLKQIGDINRMIEVSNNPYIMQAFEIVPELTPKDKVISTDVVVDKKLKKPTPHSLYCAAILDFDEDLRTNAASIVSDTSSLASDTFSCGSNITDASSDSGSTTIISTTLSSVDYRRKTYTGNPAPIQNVGTQWFVTTQRVVVRAEVDPLSPIINELMVDTMIKINCTCRERGHLVAPVRGWCWLSSPTVGPLIRPVDEEDLNFFDDYSTQV